MEEKLRKQQKNLLASIKEKGPLGNFLEEKPLHQKSQ